MQNVLITILFIVMIAVIFLDIYISYFTFFKLRRNTHIFTVKVF